MSTQARPIPCAIARIRNDKGARLRGVVRCSLGKGVRCNMGGCFDGAANGKECGWGRCNMGLSSCAESAHCDSMMQTVSGEPMSEADSRRWRVRGGVIEGRRTYPQGTADRELESACSGERPTCPGACKGPGILRSALRRIERTYDDRWRVGRGSTRDRRKCEEHEIERRRSRRVLGASVY